jgi:putative methyltransferase (TIGR04325 family)
VDEFALRAQRIYPYDYPVLFWLLPILPAAKRVFDIGGHIGVHYYGYQRYLPFPAELKWEVCEVPSIAKTGAELARQKGMHNLVFTSDFAGAEGADILLAAGSLQYIESPRIEVLCRNGNFPFSAIPSVRSALHRASISGLPIDFPESIIYPPFKLIISIPLISFLF